MKDARITTRTSSEAGAKLREKLGECFLVSNKTGGLPASMLRKSNSRLKERPKLLGFGSRRLNPLMEDQRCSQVAEESLLMRGGAAELSALLQVTHGNSMGKRTEWRGRFSWQPRAASYAL